MKEKHLTSMAACCLAAFLQISCTTNTAQQPIDPPPFEDVQAESAASQTETYEAVLAHFSTEQGVVVEHEHAPDALRVRKGNEPAVEVHVDPKTPGSPSDGSIVRMRRNIRVSNVAEIRRWITLALGSRIRGSILNYPVIPHPEEAAHAETPPHHTAASVHSAPHSTSVGGSTHVRGYYRKNGTYVRGHTRRR